MAFEFANRLAKKEFVLIFQSCLMIKQISFVISMIQLSVLPDNLNEGLDLIPHILIEAMEWLFKEIASRFR